MEHLSKEQLRVALQRYRGLIPVSILVAEEKILWLDMEQYHFYEGFFHKSLDMFRALKQGRAVSFLTDTGVLEEEGILEEFIYPQGFIFHAGRCGSTMLAKALARPQENLVISEARPHNSIWKILTREGRVPLEMNGKNMTIYRNLLLAMARRRRSAHKRFFIKFTSFNIRFFDFIHSVFPDVPALFLKRDIPAILASWEKSLPGWLERDNPRALQMLTGSDTPDLKAIIEGFMQKAEAYPAAMLKHIGYEMLKPAHLGLILSYMNYEPNAAQLALMQSQFSYDSKVEFNRKRFKA